MYSHANQLNEGSFFSPSKWIVPPEAEDIILAPESPPLLIQKRKIYEIVPNTQDNFLDRTTQLLDIDDIVEAGVSGSARGHYIFTAFANSSQGHNQVSSSSGDGGGGINSPGPNLVNPNGWNSPVSSIYRSSRDSGHFSGELRMITSTPLPKRQKHNDGMIVDDLSETGPLSAFGVLSQILREEGEVRPGDETLPIPTNEMRDEGQQEMEGVSRMELCCQSCKEVTEKMKAMERKLAEVASVVDGLAAQVTTLRNSEAVTSTTQSASTTGQAGEIISRPLLSQDNTNWTTQVAMLRNSDDVITSTLQSGPLSTTNQAGEIISRPLLSQVKTNLPAQATTLQSSAAVITGTPQSEPASTNIQAGEIISHQLLSHDDKTNLLAQITRLGNSDAVTSTPQSGPPSTATQAGEIISRPLLLHDKTNLPGSSRGAIGTGSKGIDSEDDDVVFLEEKRYRPKGRCICKVLSRKKKARGRPRKCPVHKV